MTLTSAKTKIATSAVSRSAFGMLLSNHEALPEPTGREKLVIRRRPNGGQIFEWWLTCQFCELFGHRFTIAVHRQPEAVAQGIHHARRRHGVKL